MSSAEKLIVVPDDDDDTPAPAAAAVAAAAPCKRPLTSSKMRRLALAPLPPLQQPPPPQVAAPTPAGAEDVIDLTGDDDAVAAAFREWELIDLTGAEDDDGWSHSRRAGAPRLRGSRPVSPRLSWTSSRSRATRYKPSCAHGARCSRCSAATPTRTRLQARRCMSALSLRAALVATSGCSWSSTARRLRTWTAFAATAWTPSGAVARPWGPEVRGPRQMRCCALLRRCLTPPGALPTQSISARRH